MTPDGRKGRRLVAEMNVVPYIDVMLVLLIIFMVTAPLAHARHQGRLAEGRRRTVAAGDERARSRSS